MTGFLCLLLVVLLPVSAMAEETKKEERPWWRRGTMSVQAENDLFGGGTDQHYTHGTRFSWVSEPDSAPEKVLALSEKLPFFAEDGRTRFSIAFGQNMYTPADITVPGLIEDDRPYAGWTYGSIGLLRENDRELDSLELSAGMIGPVSMAEQAQKFVHKNISNSPKPMGWGHQLHNEPGVILAWDRKWRRMFDKDLTPLQFDMTPHIGGAVGNVMTYAATGIMARLGMDLPVDYGPPRIRPSLPGSGFFVPSDSFGWYLFGGIDGRAVARNIFLDGNTFRHSRSVEKKPFVGDMQAGIAFTYGRVRLSYTKIFRSEEFEKQQSPDEFGSLNVSFRF